MLKNKPELVPALWDPSGNLSGKDSGNLSGKELCHVSEKDPGKDSQRFTERIPEMNKSINKNWNQSNLMNHNNDGSWSWSNVNQQLLIILITKVILIRQK